MNRVLLKKKVTTSSPSGTISWRSSSAVSMSSEEEDRLLTELNRTLETDTDCVTGDKFTDRAD